MWKRRVFHGFLVLKQLYFVTSFDLSMSLSILRWWSVWMVISKLLQRLWIKHTMKFLLDPRRLMLFIPFFHFLQLWKWDDSLIILQIEYLVFFSFQLIGTELFITVPIHYGPQMCFLVFFMCNTISTTRILVWTNVILFFLKVYFISESSRKGMVCLSPSVIHFNSVFVAQQNRLIENNGSWWWNHSIVPS